MISRIQTANVRQSFKNKTNNVDSELKEFKTSFLKDQSEKDYKKATKDFNRGTIGGAFFGLAWSAYDGLRGDKGSALAMLVITAVIVPLSFLFKPKKSKFDKQLQEDLKKL